MSFEAVGAMNWFSCEVCDGLTVTINQDIGITPDIIDCRASGKVNDCPGLARSAFYPTTPLPERRAYAVFRWYRPASGSGPFDAATLAYLKAGGLAIDPIIISDEIRETMRREREPDAVALRRRHAGFGVLPNPRDFIERRRN